MSTKIFNSAINDKPRAAFSRGIDIYSELLLFLYGKTTFLSRILSKFASVLKEQNR